MAPRKWRFKERECLCTRKNHSNKDHTRSQYSEPVQLQFTRTIQRELYCKQLNRVATLKSRSVTRRIGVCIVNREISGP